MTAKLKKVDFEEALTKTGFGKYNFFMLMLVGGMLMCIAFETVSVAYIVPTSACELETDTSQQGLIAAIPLVGIMVTSNLWGYLADTRGRRKVLIWSLGLGFVAGALATLSPNWIALCLLKFASSSALAGTYALAMTLLGECTPEAKRGSMIVLTTSIYLAATGSMALMAIPILPLEFSYYVPGLNIYFNSWRLLNLVYSIPCLIVAIAFFWSYESPKYLLGVGREQEALDVLRTMFVINTNQAGDLYLVEAVTLGESQKSSGKYENLWQSVKSQTLPLFRSPLSKSTLLLSIIFVTVYFSYNPYVVWLPNIADSFMRSIQRGETGLTMCQMIRATQNATTSHQSDCSLDQFAMLMIMSINIILSILNLIITAVLKYCSRKTILICIQLIAGSAAICINFSSHYVVTGLLVIVFVSGVLNFGFTITFSVDIFPTYVKAMGVCVTLMIGRGSAVLGINLLKHLLVYSCETSFYLFGSIAIFGGICALLLPSGSTRKTEEDS